MTVKEMKKLKTKLAKDKKVRDAERAKALEIDQASGLAHVAEPYVQKTREHGVRDVCPTCRIPVFPWTDGSTRTSQFFTQEHLDNLRSTNQQLRDDVKRLTDERFEQASEARKLVQRFRGLEETIKSYDVLLRRYMKEDKGDN